MLFEWHFLLYTLLIITIGNEVFVSGLFVELGEYPNMTVKKGVNRPDCGLRYKPQIDIIFYKSKCFRDTFAPKIILHIKRALLTVKDLYHKTSRISGG